MLFPRGFLPACHPPGSKWCVSLPPAIRGREWEATPPLIITCGHHAFKLPPSLINISIILRSFLYNPELSQPACRHTQKYQSDPNNIIGQDIGRHHEVLPSLQRCHRFQPEGGKGRQSSKISGHEKETNRRVHDW